MKIYALALATDWYLDDDFFELIEQVAHSRNLSTYLIFPYNLEETLFKIRDHQIRFLSLYDRGSDTSPEYLKIYPALTEFEVSFFSNLILQKKASDKAYMHEQFVINELTVPRTIILPELVTELRIHLTENDLDDLGRPFVIKPCFNTGSGQGVFLDGYTLKDVEKKRNELPEDKYLLQEKIYPKEENSRCYWFRAFYVCGKILVTWWHHVSHRYKMITAEDIHCLDIHRFNLIMKKVHAICGLNFFSTELVITEEGSIYAIDYVNDICDMRLQSKHFDGVPDQVVKMIAGEIVDYLSRSINFSSY